MSEADPAFKRVLVKLSGEALQGPLDYGTDADTVQAIARQLKAWMNDVVLLNQVHVNGDKYDGKTIEELRANLSGTAGENVVIRRFARFAVGA